MLKMNDKVHSTWKCELYLCQVRGYNYILPDTLEVE